MKLFVVLILTILSASSFSQVVDVGNVSALSDAISSYEELFENSEEVRDFVESNEQVYNVDCSEGGKTNSNFPFLRVSYKPVSYTHLTLPTTPYV